MPNFNKKVFAVAFILLATGIIINIANRLETAQANVFEDIWKNITAPFTAQSTTTIEQPASAPAPAPLYKPALDYERAVIAAVKKASPAVVSITISKNVPIIE